MTPNTPEALERGRRLFNERSYFEAHEVWETAWLEESGQMRLLLQGLIQIAAALYKASRRERPRGCALLLEWGTAKLERVGDSPAGLSLSRFRGRLTEFRRRAERWRREEAGAPPLTSFPKLTRARPGPRRRVRGRRRGTRTTSDS